MQEDRVVEINATKQNKEERKKRNESSLRDFWDSIKCTNFHIIGIPEGDKKDKEPEKIFEDIMAKKLP